MEIPAKKQNDITDLFPKGIHGVEHSFRVHKLVQKLCDLEIVTESERLLLEFCAFFHDIGRVNDNVDITHGYKSFKKLKKLNFFELTSFNNSIVKYIIENHCNRDDEAIVNSNKYNLSNPKRAIYLLLIFKDADGLDRFRLSDFDKRYLRNTNACKLIDFAEKINNKRYSNKSISNHIHSWIKSNKIV